MPQLAWIGLGNIGRGMVKNLITKGNLDKPLILWNRTQSKADSLSKELGNSTVVSTVEEAISASDIIFICVGADKDVEGIMDQAIKTDKIKGKLFVDCSTIHPDTTNGISKRLTDAGAEFVACPVFGAPAMAEAGQLITVLAGPRESVDKVKPYTKGVVSRVDIDYSGQKPGQALLLKVLGNTFILQMVQALAEGHVAAEKTGLGGENLHQFIETLFPGAYAAYSKRMMSGDYYQRDSPAFHVDLARKDAGHAVKLTEAVGVEMKAVKLADQRLAEVKEVKGDQGDLAGIYGIVRKASGLPYENQK